MTDLQASLTEVVGPQLFRLSFAYGAAVLVVQGSDAAFQRDLVACQPELLRLSRRVGIGVQLLATSSEKHTQARRRQVHDWSCQAMMQDFGRVCTDVPSMVHTADILLEASILNRQASVC